MNSAYDFVEHDFVKHDSRLVVGFYEGTKKEYVTKFVGIIVTIIFV